MKTFKKLLNKKLIVLSGITGIALSAVPASAAEITKDLNIGAELWSEFDLNFTSNNSSTAFSVDRARLTTKYKLEDQYDLNIALDTSSTGSIMIDRAYLSHSRENGVSRFGYIKDEYISWLNAASGLEWVNVSLTQLGFRNRKALGADYQHNFADGGTLLVSIQNGNDDSYGSTAADQSLNYTAAYKMALNEDLDGQTYFSFQNKDEDSTASANGIIRFGAAIAGGSETFRFLGEFALVKTQVDGSSALLGFGATATYAFRPMHHFYGRFYTGNEAAQNDSVLLGGSVKNSFELGLLKDINKHLNAGILGEFSNTTADTTNTNVKLRLAAKF